eukprot:182488-Rhodomonas_salina.3
MPPEQSLPEEVQVNKKKGASTKKKKGSTVKKVKRGFKRPFRRIEHALLSSRYKELTRRLEKHQTSTV